ncbi:MAG: hypothetical protein Q9167_000838 [Letrouitia subvulpina]
MDGSTRAHILLKATRFASTADVTALHLIIHQHSETLLPELVLRIILTYLPESTDPPNYHDLILQLANGQVNAPQHSVPQINGPDQNLSDHEARLQVRRLHLLPIAEQQEIQNGCDNVLEQFLVHRARQIDTETGDLFLAQQLLQPFLTEGSYLQSWMIAYLLPLIRLNYEYYPDRGTNISLSDFEKLEGHAAIDFLLAEAVSNTDEALLDISRDMKGIVGPWVSGNSATKRRKTNHNRSMELEVPRIGQSQNAENETVTSPKEWSDVNEWLLELSSQSFLQAADAFEKWDGPGDVDLGELGSKEDNPHVGGLHQQNISQLTRSYVQAAMAAIYTTNETSIAVLERSQYVLQKVAQHEGLPNLLGVDGALALGVDERLSTEFLDGLSEAYLLHNSLLSSSNQLTIPTKSAVRLTWSFLSSCKIMHRLHHPISCRVLAELSLFRSEKDQWAELRKVISGAVARIKSYKEWSTFRFQIQTLSSSNFRQDSGTPGEKNPAVPFSRVPTAEWEKEVLNGMLRTGCYDFAAETYCPRGSMHRSPILDNNEVENAIVKVALSVYDGASNGNKSRGGVQKAYKICSTFKEHFPQSKSFQQLEALILATHAMSFYSLTLEHGVPFQPVNIRAQKDPLSLIGKILSQTPKSYTKLDDLVEIGQNLGRAGLFQGDRESPIGSLDDQLLVARRRVNAMCIEAALAEHDFDTAYSYIINRISQPSTDTAPGPEGGQEDDENDTSWRAAYLAGQYNLDGRKSVSLRRLEQRMEILSVALFLAPSANLADILSVWQSCEEEYTALLAKETADEDQWDSKGDQRLSATSFPGGFAPSLREQDRAANESAAKLRSQGARASHEEAPMGLFDVARGAAAALGRNAFPLREAAQGGMQGKVASPGGGRGGREAESHGGEERTRKRDMVANAVTGGLASGIGWVIGAPPPAKS